MDYIISSQEHRSVEQITYEHYAENIEAPLSSEQIQYRRRELSLRKRMLFSFFLLIACLVLVYLINVFWIAHIF